MSKRAENVSVAQDAEKSEQGLAHRYPSHFRGQPASLGDKALCGWVKVDPRHYVPDGWHLCVVCNSLAREWRA